jgi:hypothetical protein
MAKFPAKKPSVKSARPAGPVAMPPIPSGGPMNQPSIKMPKAKKPLGPPPSSGMPAQMGAPPMV